MVLVAALRVTTKRTDSVDLAHKLQKQSDKYIYFIESEMSDSIRKTSYVKKSIMV